jgi:hypothetical protein
LARRDVRKFREFFLGREKRAVRPLQLLAPYAARREKT